MSTKKRALRLLLIAPVVAAILVAFGGISISQPASKAEAVGSLTVGLDMKTLQTDPGTYGTTLPRFENCVDVNTSVNSYFYIDVFVLNATNLIAFTADVSFTAGKMQIMNADVKKLFGTGSQVTNYSTNVVDHTGDVVNPPVSSGTFEAYAIDFSALTHSGSGVLVRFKVQAFNSAATVVNFNISTDASKGITLTADPGGTHPGDTNGDGIFDGPFINAATAKIAINQTADTDGDGVSNTCDNCPTTPNGAAQAGVPHVGNQDDQDGDGVGDACDPDIDGDTFANGSDDCPYVYDNPQNASVCADSDGDGVINSLDNCPNTPNANQANNDGDALGDVCDADDDNDGVPDTTDNCHFIANANQADWNNDGVGDACQDSDGDNVMDSVDNCRGLANPSQADGDGDGVGDSCDNCPVNSNSSQADMDHDFIGDACDPDIDGDGFSNVFETYVGTNTMQRCPTTGAPPANNGRNDEAVDSTPYDNDDNRLVNGSDLLSYAPVFGTTGPNPPYQARYDMTMDNKINGNDLLSFAIYFGKPACVYP